MTRDAVTWFAPGRANLMGEHTDYNDGLVLPFALAQGVTATASPRSDGVLALHSKQAPGDRVTVRLSDLRPGEPAGWAAYPAGVAWALAQAGYPVTGADIDIDSDLPVGAGVSSSAALECSVALALAEVSGHQIGRRDLAAIARRAENDFVGAPTGIIDQSASLLCQEGHAMLLDCGTREIRQVPFRPADDGMAALIIDTKVPHALADGQYAARRHQCEEAARRLGVGSLRDLTHVAWDDELDDIPSAPPLARLADPILGRRVRHVVSDTARVQQVAALLDGIARPGELPRSTRDAYRILGEVLTAGHASLRDDFEVSWEQADVTVETVLEAGALGAKMIGGGFGGSVLALVPVAALRGVQSAARAEFGRRSWDSPEFLEAIPSPAARRIPERVLGRQERAVPELGRRQPRLQA